MGPLEAELEVIDLIFLGSFHPGLVQPSWLARQGLISDSEADEATISVITNDVAQFSTDWFMIEVVAERLRILTQLSAFRLSLRDLAVGLLASMPATAVSAFGINHSGHFKLDSEQKWHRLGHKLAPKDVWTKFVREPGTLNLQIIGPRSDDRRGSHTYTVQPSNKIEHGVFLSSNDHYDLTTDESEESSSRAASLVNEVFEASIELSAQYFKEMVQYADSLEKDG